MVEEERNKLFKQHELSPHHNGITAEYTQLGSGRFKVLWALKMLKKPHKPHTGNSHILREIKAI